MSNLTALGYFMDYCNKNMHLPEVTQERFERGIREILSSQEGRFANCVSVNDILRKLTWW